MAKNILARHRVLGLMINAKHRESRSILHVDGLLLYVVVHVLVHLNLGRLPRTQAGGCWFWWGSHISLTGVYDGPLPAWVDIRAIQTEVKMIPSPDGRWCERWGERVEPRRGTGGKDLIAGVA